MLFHRCQHTQVTLYAAVIVKSSTISSYEATIKNHIKPCLGSIKLESLTTQDIQEFYNARHKGDESRKPLSPKTIKNIHGVLHKALEQAMLNGLIRTIPPILVCFPEDPSRKSSR